MLRKAYEVMPFKGIIDRGYFMLPDKMKYGSVFNRTYQLLEDTQWWNRDEHEKYQFSRLNKILVHAYEHTKYYNEVFDKCGFNPYKIQSIQDIERIPFLDRDIITERFDDLIADNIPRGKSVLGSTGGTTGNQLHFMVPKEMYQIEQAFVMHIWQRAGYHYGRDLIAVLRNEIIPDGKLYYIDRKHNRIVFNNYQLVDNNIDAILNIISQRKIRFMHAYPSAVITLAEYMRRCRKKYNLKLETVLLTSENIYHGQKKLIEETLGGRCFSFYGHSERACIAWWCECSDKYHIDDEYSYTELINEDGNVITGCDKVGEIVCTSLWNYSMPFIRYRTADYSEYSSVQLCKCGRHYRLFDDIYGRWTQEMIVRGDGSKVSITAMNMHSAIFKNVKSYQMVQNEQGKMVIKIVKGDNFGKKDEIQIITEYKKKLGRDFQINVAYVNEIEKTVRGKHRYLIQHLEV